MGDWMGERGSKRWIEGFGLLPSGGVAPADVEYQAVLGRGWLSPWAEGGQFCGSRGMSLPILGLRVRLKGAAAATHTVAVSATFVDGTAVGPVSDGEPCEAPSLSPLESFQVTLTPIGQQAAPKARRTAPPAAASAKRAPKMARAPAPPAPMLVPVAAAKPAGRPVGKPAGKPVGKSADKPVGKPAGKPIGKPAGKPIGKPGPKAAAASPAPAKRTPATTRRR